MGLRLGGTAGDPILVLLLSAAARPARCQQPADGKAHRSGTYRHPPNNNLQVFQGQASTPAAASTKKDAPKKKPAAAETSEGGIAPQSVAFPGACALRQRRRRASAAAF